MDVSLIDRRLSAITRQPFRSRFRLRGRELAYTRERGLDSVAEHAADLIAKRLAPAKPCRDTKQTPYKGHPVFVAQHATATCCRKCLQRWHEIPRGRELSDGEQAYVVEVIRRYLKRELEQAG